LGALKTGGLGVNHGQTGDAQSKKQLQAQTCQQQQNAPTTKSSHQHPLSLIHMGH
jgi:hypothetical protein